MISVIFVLLGDVHQLIEFASFLIWIFYGASVACLLVLRRTCPDLPRPYKVPLIIPIVTLVVAVFLSVTPLVTEPPEKYLAALAFILSGLVFYIPFVYYKYRPTFMGEALGGAGWPPDILPLSITHLLTFFFYFFHFQIMSRSTCNHYSR